MLAPGSSVSSSTVALRDHALGNEDRIAVRVVGRPPEPRGDQGGEFTGEMVLTNLRLAVGSISGNAAPERRQLRSKSCSSMWL